MPQWLTDCLKTMTDCLGVKPYASSTGHRNAERINAGTEVIGSSLETFSPAGEIPTKLAQSITSLYSLFRADTVLPEKAIHLVQFGISSAQLGLAITLLFNGSICTATDTEVCKAIFLLQLLYRGTLMVGWIPSEFSKQPYEEPAEVQAQLNPV
ncbi:hypothetical protein [uncultured Legionella sp.]|uniref:hypothetical protein n=1 Tax=uncultured Legionella sp. TaxID=210934 RepID=UPI00260FAF89|nr:hypothetical protein [uncultured Legionella sp.]